MMKETRTHYLLVPTITLILGAIGEAQETSPTPSPTPSPYGNWRAYQPGAETPEVKIGSSEGDTYRKVTSVEDLPMTVEYDEEQHTYYRMVRTDMFRSSTPPVVPGWQGPLPPSDIRNLYSPGPWAIKCSYSPTGDYIGHRKPAWLTEVYDFNPPWTYAWYGSGTHTAVTKAINNPTFDWSLTGAEFKYHSSLFVSPFQDPQRSYVSLGYEHPNLGLAYDSNLEGVGTYSGTKIGAVYKNPNLKSSQPMATSTLRVAVKDANLGAQSPTWTADYSIVWHWPDENFQLLYEGQDGETVRPLSPQIAKDNDLTYYEHEDDGEYYYRDGLETGAIYMQAVGVGAALVPGGQELGAAVDFFGQILGVAATVLPEAPEPKPHSIPVGWQDFMRDVQEAENPSTITDPTDLQGTFEVEPSYMKAPILEKIQQASPETKVLLDGVEVNFWDKAKIEMILHYPKIRSNWISDGYDQEGYVGSPETWYWVDGKRRLEPNWSIDLQSPSS